jgi:hypothetical protein
MGCHASKPAAKPVKGTKVGPTLLGPESHKADVESRKTAAVETSVAALQEEPAPTAGAKVVAATSTSTQDQHPAWWHMEQTSKAASTEAPQEAPVAAEASSTLQDVQSPSQVPMALGSNDPSNGLWDPLRMLNPMVEEFGAVEGQTALSTKPLHAVDDIVPDTHGGEQSAPLQRQLQHSSSLNLEEPPETVVKTKGTATEALEAEKLTKDSQVQKRQKNACCC